MIRSKHFLYMLLGIGMLAIGIWQLPFRWSLDLSSIYFLLWTSFATLYVLSQIRGIRKWSQMRRLLEEQQRRQRWLRTRVHPFQRSRRNVTG